MASASERLASLRDWPLENVVTRRSLASAGLSYSGHGDEVTCVHCSAALSDWHEEDEPVACHATFYPGCTFLAAEHPDAVCAAMEDEGRRFATFPRHWCCEGAAKDVACGPGCSQLLAGEGFFHCADRQICCISCLARFDLPSRFNDPWLAHADASHACRALLEDMPPSLLERMQSSADARMATFRAGWPAGDVVDPQALVDSGLYYTLAGDTVHCAFCRKGIQGWEDGDEPWEEHGKLHPACPLVQMHAQYADVAARRASYSNNCDMPFTTDSLAAAGFIWRRAEDGGGDGVQCYQCLLRVTEWLDDRCAWTRHARLSPHCSHVLRLAPARMLGERFCLRSSRVASFTSACPLAAVGTTAEAFADCGFFYCATGDAVRCFSCGVVLRLWEEGDSVWLEHWRHSRDCSLVCMRPPNSPAWLAVCVASQISDQDLAQIVASSSAATVRSVLEAWPLDGAALTASSLRKQLPAVPDTLAAAAALSATGAGRRPAVGDHGTEVPSAPVVLDLDDQMFDDSVAVVEPPAKREHDGDRLSCKVCMDNEVCVVFQPCGHMNCCQECSEQVRLCPLCRTGITARVRVFL